jgi:hypothetical protein
MQNIGLILLVFAFVIACIASRMPEFRTWHLGWLAVAFWIASEVIGGIQRVLH